MKLIDIDKTKFTSREKIIFRQLNPSVIQLFYSSEWPLFAYEYLEEFNKDFLDTLELFLNVNAFYQEIERIGRESYTTYLEEQQKTILNDRTIIVDDIQKHINTLKLEAREIAQNDIKTYISEKINQHI